VAIRFGLESEVFQSFVGHLRARSEKAIGTVDWTPRTIPIGIVLDASLQIFRSRDNLESQGPVWVS
jgi:hypothetical protein